ncbi:site-2 protease family protein [Streptomyces globosus]|uniref:site-2 protease family protein n=1 Tax=Streptomyces globosus TaxID=68209 RepID=UPI001FEAE916|nr:site-2 protease family protein [Streptomyces globosus]
MTAVKPTFSLGTIAGVRVGVHWSVLVIVAVIALVLSGRLPAAHPGRPGWQYAVTTLVAAAFLLLSLLAHELSHAVVARRNGVAVGDITLWLLGGMARLGGEPPTPGAEARIAGVGPLVSLLLGLLFGLLAGAAAAALGAGLAVEALAWLGGINVLLAVFNALPAAPLDGGRLLRAVVWRRTGDRLRATAVATGASRLLGWALVAVGLLLVLRGVPLSGIWIVLVGWFLVAVATAEGSQAKLEELLSGVTVGEAMGRDPVTVPASLAVGRFLAAPQFRFRHSAFPVVDADRRPVGLVSVNAAARVPEERHGTTRVADVMIPIEEVPTPHPGDPLTGVLPVLESSPAHRAVVLAGGAVVGVVTSSDVSRVTSWLASSRWRKRAV